MKQIIIIALVFLMSINMASAISDNINWDDESVASLITGDITWTYTEGGHASHGNFDGGIAWDQELLALYVNTYDGSGGWYKLTSDLITRSGENNVSVWFRGMRTGTATSYAHNYIRILDEEDNVVNSQILFYCKGLPSGTTHYYDCTNVSIYDAQTWYCNNVSIPSENFKIEFYGVATNTFNNVYSKIYIDLMHFNEECNVTAPDPPQADSTFYLYDDCANLLINPTTTIFRNMTTQIYQGNDNPIIINEEGNYNRFDKFSVIIDTHDMAEEKTVYADDEFNIYHLHHSHVDWDLQVHVYDNFTSVEIEEAKVSLRQDCKIGGYPLYTYALTNEYGYMISQHLSNQNFTVECNKTGYKDYYSEFEGNFCAWNGTYFIEVFLDNITSDDDGNETLPEVPCSSAWSNDDNLIISEINDTQNARLHYMAGDTTTLLYLERWSEVGGVHLWMMEGSSITLDPHERGYIQYTPANWTEDETTIYRGRLWSLNCYCDDTSTLKVWNATDENETIFENLTVSIKFLNKVSGHLMNPASPVKIDAYAASNNTSLLNIDLQLFNESVKVENESLTFFDWYDGSQFVTYSWLPSYSYSNGFNYTVKMVGFNGDIIAIDHVYTNESPDIPFITANELTVFVKDNHNQQLPYSTVFIENWGSITTGEDNYVTIEGLPDGDYQYKATKSGYISSPWATITLTEHESVTCVLVEIADTVIIGQKMSNAEIKSIFIPLMYILMIFILLGAFKYAMQ